MLEQKLNVKLSQKLTLTPALQQAIKLLQMTIPELQEEINQELMENPLLEDVSTHVEDEPESDSGEEPAESQDEKREEEFNIEEYFRDSGDDEYVPVNRNTRDFSDDREYSYENYLAEPESLYDHLEWQLQMNLDDNRVFETARAILRYLDDDGYLRVPVPPAETEEWLAFELEAPAERIQAALKAIRELDPPGVGAVTLSECLLIQVRNLGLAHDQILCRIIEDHLGDLADDRLDRIAAMLHLEPEGLASYLDLIRSLEPKPGRAFSTSQTVYIVPDVYVYKVGDVYQVQLNDEGLPHLRVSRRYASLMGRSRSAMSQEEKETASYVKDRFRSAMWVIRSIQNRQRTILKVARSIVERQREFLDRGVEYMKPLTLKDVAEDIGMHESTVARVVKNKYMHTPRGLLEMRYFFSAKISSHRGEDVSSLAVKEKIRKIVETESQQKPYSDSAIVNILKSHGIHIARRTVAKYREELGIPSSSNRKLSYRRST